MTGLFLVVFFLAPIVNNVLNTDSLATLAEQRSAGFYYNKLFTDPYYLRSSGSRCCSASGSH